MFLDGIVHTCADGAKEKKNRPAGPWVEALVNPS
jgi:hypothetical protein